MPAVLPPRFPGQAGIPAILLHPRSALLGKPSQFCRRSDQAPESWWSKEEVRVDFASSAFILCELIAIFSWLLQTSVVHDKI
ncbi:MAG: hypothetical protein ACOCUY_03625, partial [Verrucomicrobiota bacterium]